MSVIAVVNRKGGSGKSTLAAHLAAWSARQGHAVMLGDLDRQQSSRAWLKRRATGLPLIAPWALEQRHMLRVPSGVSHVVLDTPGELRGFELARIVMLADVVVLPVCPSVPDRESAADCLAELMALPRIAGGRCRLGVVGMRVDGRTQGAAALRDWSQGLGIPFLGALRETQMYVRSLERGLTVFDLPAAQVATDLAQWQPVLDWLGPLLSPPFAARLPLAAEPPSVRLGSSRPTSLMPAQEALIHGSRLALRPAARPLPAAAPTATPAQPRLTGNGQRIPQFLRRGL